MKKLWIGLLLGMTSGACGTEDDARLAEFKSALPSRSALSAPASLDAAAGDMSMMAVREDASDATQAVGDPALFLSSSLGIVEGVNGAVGWVVDTLEAVTDFPPSVYNSETQEYVWGPFSNDDGVGYVSVYIRKNDESEDFDFTYAFVRGIDRDLANSVIIIAGGATPLNPELDDPSTLEDNEFGEGVLLVDFDADRAFDEEHDPLFDAVEHDQGKFVAVFGKQPSEDDPEAIVTMVVAAFRNFVSTDDPGAQPSDVDYLYGRVEETDMQADFLNYRLPIEITEGDDGLREDTEVQLALINEGYGRAEVLATGGSLMSDETITGVECWDEGFGRTYLNLASNAGGGFSYTEGSSDGCVAPFDVPLDDLEIPSLDDIPAEDYQQISDAAQNGLNP